MNDGIYNKAHNKEEVLRLYYDVYQEINCNKNKNKTEISTI